MEKKFAYLPGLIPVILVEYFLIVALFSYYRYCSYRCKKVDVIPQEINVEDVPVSDQEMGFPSPAVHDKPDPLAFRFENTFESFTPRLRYLLFITRFVSFYYICGVSVAANYVLQGGRQWFYFTLWNVELLSIYYMLATCASIIGFVYSKTNRFLRPDRPVGETEPVVWSSHAIRFGHMIHVLFQVCGGTAILVTLVNFTVLNPNMVFWNVSAHLIPILTILVEFFLNNMFVHFQHLPYNLTWAFLYLIFIWPVVVLGNISFWPYPFLALDTYVCYFWYTGLVIVDVLCYSIFYGISCLKGLFRAEFERQNRVIIRATVPKKEEELDFNGKYEQKVDDESKDQFGEHFGEDVNPDQLHLADLPFEL